MPTEKEMPKYKCHKKVHALKIADLQPACGNHPAKDFEETDGGLILTPAEKGFAPFKIDFTYRSKHSPQIGGYYVVYEDGYKSFSPAIAFEDGYTKID